MNYILFPFEYHSYDTNSQIIIDIFVVRDS